jgi:hypothetical protein
MWVDVDSRDSRGKAHAAHVIVLGNAAWAFASSTASPSAGFIANSFHAD